MDDHVSNPVGRLYLFLEYCWNQAPQQPCRVAWSDYLEVSADPSFEFYSGATSLLRLPGEARAAVGRYTGPIPQDRLLQELAKSQSALEVINQLGNPLQVMKDRYDVGTLATLEFASLAVGEAENTVVLEDAARQSIHEAADELVRALREDEKLPNEVKRVLFDHADAIVHALNLERVGGAKLVLAEWDRLRGEAGRDPGVLQQAATSRPVRDALIKLGASLALITAVTHPIHEISQDVSDVFDALEGHVAEQVIAPANERAGSSETVS